MKTFALFGVFALSALAASWTGVISDAGCGAKHGDGSEKSVACAKACITKKGAGAVLVVGDKVVKIADASKDKIVEHIGHKVTINGKMDGETILVDSVAMAH